MIYAAAVLTQGYMSQAAYAKRVHLSCNDRGESGGLRALTTVEHGYVNINVLAESLITIREYVD